MAGPKDIETWPEPDVYLPFPAYSGNEPTPTMQPVGRCVCGVDYIICCRGTALYLGPYWVVSRSLLGLQQKLHTL